MTRVLVSDLLPDQNYALRVRAVSGTIKSEWSMKLDFTTMTDDFNPMPPTGSTWVVSGDTFHAEWNAVTTNTNGDTIPITRYEVELVASGITRIVSVPPTSGDKVTYDLSFEQNRVLFNGTPQHTVALRVRAVDNKELKSAWTSPALSATNPAPGAPTAVDAVAGTGTIDISWTPPTDTDIIGYNVYIGAAKIWSGDATRFTYQTTTYTSQTFTVKAVDKFLREGTGASDSATANSPFIVDSTPPDAPYNFAVTISDDPAYVLLTQQAVAKWNKTADSSLAGYHIRYKKSGTTNWRTVDVPPDAQPLTPPGGPVPTRVDYLVTTALEPNVIYDFEIRSYDTSANKSSWVALSTNALTPTVEPLLTHALVIGGGGYIESESYGVGVGFHIDEDSITIHDGNIAGQAITTGLIQSNETGRVWDSETNAYITDPDGQPTWAINLDGAATFTDVLVKGVMVVGEYTDFEDYDPAALPTVASGTYVPGSKGWILRADGMAEFRSVAVGSLDGAALADGTMRAEALISGTVNAVLTMSGSIESAASPALISCSTTNGSATITTTGVFYPDDVGVTVTGTGIPIGAYVLTYNSQTSVTISANATTTATNNTLTFQRGRRVTVSGSDGIKLKRADGLIKVHLPTDPSLPATFNGTITSDNVYVSDGLKVYGQNNYVGTNAIVGLDPGSFTARTAPVLSFSWDSIRARNSDGTIATFSGSSGGGSPSALATGFFYDPTSQDYYYAYDNTGPYLRKIEGTGANHGYLDATGIYLGNWMVGGANVEIKGFTADATYFYFLTRNKSGGGSAWRYQVVSRTNLFKVGGPLVGDSAYNVEWEQGDDDGQTYEYGKHGVAVYGGNAYICKQQRSGTMYYIYRYASTFIGPNEVENWQVPYFTQESIMGFEVGKFDIHATNVYAAITTRFNGSNAPIVVIAKLTGTSGSGVSHDLGLSFLIPESKSPLGTTWVGTSRDDSTGHFKSLTEDAYIYTHTKLAAASTATTTTAYQRWRGTGTGGSGLGLGPVGPTATTTFTRRAKMTISSTSAIPTVGTNPPNSVSFWVGGYRYPDIGIGELNQTVTEFRISDAGGTVAALGSGPPGKITNGTSALVISGDGSVTASRVYHSNPYFKGTRMVSSSVAGSTLYSYDTRIDPDTRWGLSVANMYSVPITGKYRVTVNFKWVGSLAGDTNVFIRKAVSGVHSTIYYSHNIFNLGYGGANISWVGDLNANDNIGVMFGQTFTNQLDGGADNNYVIIEYLRP